MVFGFLGFLLSWRRKVYILRRRYDRVREKAVKQGNVQKRLAALKILDQVEPTLKMLEEQRLSSFDRGRLLAQVRVAVEQARNVLKKGYIPQQPAYQAGRPVRGYA